MSLQKKLLKMFDGENERCGFVLKTGDVVEVDNICEQPADGFEMRGEDLIEHLEIAMATWHTHPKTTANLSVNDLEAFLNYPTLQHYIVGTDGVRCYSVENGIVLNA